MPTLLVADDEEMVREAVASYFIKKGYQVVSAGNGIEALQSFRSRQIDLMILDLMLPDMSGEEVCRSIRQSSGVPVIMLTAKTAEEDMLTGFGIGADNYIKKPFSLKELFARAEAVLRRTNVSGNRTGAVIPVWRCGELEAAFSLPVLKKNGTEIALTPTENMRLSID